MPLFDHKYFLYQIYDTITYLFINYFFQDTLPQSCHIYSECLDYDTTILVFTYFIKQKSWQQ